MSYQSIFEQTAQWEQLRVGKFTASEIHRLFVSGRGKAEYFGKGAHAYIREVLAEIATGQPVGGQEKYKQMEWGEAHELEAVMEFEKRTGLVVNYNGSADPEFMSFPGFEDMAGASRDGIIEGVAIVEVKCPYDSTNHIANLFISNQQQLKEERPDYYWQIMMNAVCSGVNKGYFVSYDPRMFNTKLRLLYMEVDTWEEDVAELTERIGEAVKSVKAFLEILEP